MQPKIKKTVWIPRLLSCILLLDCFLASYSNQFYLSLSKSVMFLKLHSHSLLSPNPVVLNLFYAISHFSTPDLNIPLLLAMSFGTLLSTPQQHTPHSRSPQTSLLGIMNKIQTNYIVLRAANIVFQTSLEISRSAQCYAIPQAIRPAQAQEKPAEWELSPG